MSIPSIRNAYLEGMLTRGEASVSLRNHPDDDELIGALIQEWDQIVADGGSPPYHIPGPDPHTRFCTRCGQHKEPRELSRRGVCLDCQDKIAWQVTSDLVQREGHYYRVWRNGMLRAAYRLEDESILARRQPHDLDHGDLIDHDKAPPCQGDCYDCSIEPCKWRVESHVRNAYLGDFAPDSDK